MCYSVSVQFFWTADGAEFIFAAASVVQRTRRRLVVHRQKEEEK